jgi:competence protein ComEA
MSMHHSSRLVSKIPILLAVCLITVTGLAPGFAAPAEKKTAAGKATPSESSSESKGAAIDINSADVETLMELPGIGEGIAQRIVDYRKEHGPFENLDELLNVKGVGERMLQKIRVRLTVGAKK